MTIVNMSLTVEGRRREEHCDGYDLKPVVIHIFDVLSYQHRWQSGYIIRGYSLCGGVCVRGKTCRERESRWRVMVNSEKKKMVWGETHPEFLLQQKPRGTRESSKTVFAVLIYKETAQLGPGNTSCLWRLQCEVVSIYYNDDWGGGRL